jgi:hypothetical protein
MGTNPTGCTEWERDYDPITEQPMTQKPKFELKAAESELLDALCEAHRQVDSLLAQIIMLDNSFVPSKSPLWPEIMRRYELLRKYGASP